VSANARLFAVFASISFSATGGAWTVTTHLFSHGQSVDVVSAPVADTVYPHIVFLGMFALPGALDRMAIDVAVASVAGSPVLNIDYFCLLAMDDANNDSGDFCSAECKIENSGGGGGGSGGGGSGSGGRDNRLGETQVTIQGRAFPNATVHILIDGDQVGTVRTNGRGEFLFNTATTPGTASFGFWATDAAGTRSTTVNTTFDVTQGAITNLSGILIPPTIRASNPSTNPNTPLTLSGQTIPNVTVEVRIDPGARNLSATADSFGNWSLPISSGLPANEYAAKARFVEQTGALKTESPYGTALSLFIGVAGKATSNADLNRDGKVNLTDFSILVFWWGTAGGNSNPPADINGNGKVGLEDFSILLFNWTG
jgi:hypothetical protein